MCSSKKIKHWTFNSKELPDNAIVIGKYNQIIEIKKARSYHSGYYRCIYEDNKNNYMEELGELEVIGRYSVMYTLKQDESLKKSMS